MGPVCDPIDIESGRRAMTEKAEDGMMGAFDNMVGTPSSTFVTRETASGFGPDDCLRLLSARLS